MDETVSQALRQALLTAAPYRRVLVGFSGGMDSTVLLHRTARLLDQTNTTVIAIHVNHQLHEQSDHWQAHCEAVCGQLGVPLESHRVTVRDAGEGLEAAARAARYRVFADQAEAGDVLLLAHHQQDQAETMLMRLLRGSGPLGMAAMAPARRWQAQPGKSLQILRPFLAVGRDALEAYALANRLNWIEDPSNQDIRFDRNYLRQKIFPGLAERWPTVVENLARSAELSREAAELCNQLAKIDLAACLQVFETPVAGSLQVINCSALAKLPPERQRNGLRGWLMGQGVSLPSRAVLQRVVDEVLPAREDSEPEVCFSEGCIRRFQGCLFFVPPLPEFDRDQCQPWQGEPMMLPSGIGQLMVKPGAASCRIAARWLSKPMEIRYRQGGERCRPAGREKSQKLKKLFQEYQVLPWYRDRLPLLYIEGELAAVPGLWVCDGFAPAHEEDADGLLIRPGGM